MDWMKELQDEWDSTPVDTDGGGRIPDGKHRAVVADYTFDETLRAIRYRIGFPDLQDRSLNKTTFLFDKEGREQFKWAKKELAVLGITDFKLVDLPNYGDKLIGKALEVSIITPAGKAYSNIYFNRQVEALPSDTTASW